MMICESLIVMVARCVEEEKGGGVLSREALNDVSEVDSIGLHVPGFDLHYLRSFIHQNKKTVSNLQYCYEVGPSLTLPKALFEMYAERDRKRRQKCSLKRLVS
ncbi:uncharacterized protein HKW66_Vig0067650 [Vigna angularis]|uniref:Uncharacterized protein n=1 Tax=Phaseolus angularis TaxID=3914 RepID=A0A8T0K9C9_PHAAN|nr:uncharacterized protein HKW66_Vig0067650 [Vigna angularis]